MAGGQNSRLISVIIPTYNYGRFLKECLASVFAQTVQDFEIIVVDDGSNDDTPEILASIADPRLRTFRISNSGVSVARNLGLQEARGEVVAFLDADDRWRSNKLERQVSLLGSEPSVGTVFTDFVRFNESQILANEFSYYPELPSIPSRPSLQGEGSVITTDAFSELISFKQFPAYVQTVLFRRELARGLAFPSGTRVSEDLYFLMRLYARAQVAYIPEPLVEVRRHGKNTGGEKGGSLAFEQMEADLNALLMLEKDATSLKHKRAIRARLGKLHCSRGHHYFWQRKPALAARSYLNCLAYPRSRMNALFHLLALPFTPVLGLRSTRE
jgi:glycosyltransferase involved in cell wall biosynthesis